MQKTLVLAAGVVACGLMVRAEESRFVFVENGQAKSAIVASKDMRQLDLDFFTNAVYQCTGAAVPIVEVEGVGGGCRCTKDGENSIVDLDLRPGPNLIKFVVEERSVLSEDDYAVSFPDAKTLKITGSADSCRWALNRILEDAFGVVFCLPGRNGTHYPKSRTVAMDPTPWTDKPVYELERDDTGGMDPRWKRCLNAKYFERLDTTSHFLREVFKDPKFFKEPWVSKLMPLINGKRQPPKQIHKLWEPCFACKEGVDEAVAYIVSYLREHPKQKWFSLGVNDCGGFCECDGCKAMNGGSVTAKCKFDKNYPSFSDAYGRWCNAIAERVEKEFPDVLLGFSAYRETIDPPSFKLHKNIVSSFCVETLQWMDDENRERFSGLFDAWAKVCDQLMIYDYAYGSHYLVPRMYNRLLQEVLSSKLTKYPSLNGWKGECGNPWKEGPKFWLHFKLLWKPDVDLDRTLDTWYRACAGDEAAPYLKEFYDLWEEFCFTPGVKKTQWYTYTSHFVYFWFFWQQYLYALDASRIERCAKLSKLALEAAERSGTDDQKARMRELAVWQRQAVVDALAGGAGAVTNPLGNIKTDEDVAFFEKSFPRMQKATLKARAGYDAITALIARDIEGIADTPKWRCHLDLDMRKAERFSRAPNRLRLINQYLAVKNAAADPTGRNYVAKDAALEGADATVAAKGDGGWTVTATGKRPQVTTVVTSDPEAREYFATVRVRNTTAHKLRFSIAADTWSRKNKKAFNDPQTQSGEVEPGKTATVNVLVLQTANFFSGETDIFLKVAFANLAPGESAFVESLALRLPSARALRLDTAPAVTGAQREDGKINTTTWEDQQDL